VFEGASNLSLDAKGRLSMPTRYRDALKSTPGSLRITRHPDSCLLIFPLPAWERFRDSFGEMAIEDQWLKRFFLGHATEVDMDGTGRILVSPELRAATRIERETKLLGMGDYFELWDRPTHDAQEAQALSQRMTSEAMKKLKF
jgi:MraZ protein